MKITQLKLGDEPTPGSLVMLNSENAPNTCGILMTVTARSGAQIAVAWRSTEGITQTLTLDNRCFVLVEPS